MKLNNNCFLFLGLLSLLLTSSCKKVAKEASEEIMEKGTKSLSKEFTEESLENISKRELKTITWEDFYKVIAKRFAEWSGSDVVRFVVCFLYGASAFCFGNYFLHGRGDAVPIHNHKSVYVSGGTSGSLCE